MKNFKKINFIPISFLTVIVLFMAFLNYNQSETKTFSIIEKYKFVSILDIPFGEKDSHYDSLFRIVKSPDKVFSNEFVITNQVFNFWGYNPFLVYIDADENFYINNEFEGLKVFNRNGEFVYKIDYPITYTLNLKLSSVDNNDLYLILKNNLDTSQILNNECIIYHVNIKNNIEERLSVGDFIRKNEDDHQRIVQGNDVKKEEALKNQYGEFYDLKYQSSNFELLSTGKGKLIHPLSFSIFKFDNGYNRIDMSYGVPNQFLFADVDICQYTDCSIKVIYVTRNFIDENGNIYFSGFKSDSASYNEKNDINIKFINVSNPSFFLWKLEKQQ